MIAAAKVDCYGIEIPMTELLEICKTFYWGGGVWGHPDGATCEFSRVYARLFKMGIVHPELMTTHFLDGWTEADRTEETLKAFINWVRKNHPNSISFKEGSLPLIRWIIKRCPQMRFQAETYGKDASYETWRGVLSLCKFTDDGNTPEIIEALTGAHPDYDFAEAQRKMEDISAPFLCNTLAGNNESLCNTCKFHNVVNSPIALAYPNEPKLKRGVK